MSVLVATAYMEEADRFEWFVAMDSGRILATGSPQELKSRTGARRPRAGLHLAAAGVNAAGTDPSDSATHPRRRPAIEAQV